MTCAEVSADKAAYRINSFDVREVRDWGNAAVLRHDAIPAGPRAGYFTPKGSWVKPSWLPAYAIRECQDWRKTCRAFARVYGFAVAVYCDDTAITFALTHSGKVKESKRHDAKIAW